MKSMTTEVPQSLSLLLKSPPTKITLPLQSHPRKTIPRNPLPKIKYIQFDNQHTPLYRTPIKPNHPEQLLKDRY